MAEGMMGSLLGAGNRARRFARGMVEDPRTTIADYLTMLNEEHKEANKQRDDDTRTMLYNGVMRDDPSYKAARAAAEQRSMEEALDYVGGGLGGAVKKIRPPKQVVEEALRKTKELQSQLRISVPAGEQFWPWRVDPGGFEAAFDAKTGKWYPKRVHSEGEKTLTKAIEKAQKEVTSGVGVTNAFDLANLKYPPMRNQTLPVPQHVTGRPAWVARDINDEAAKRWDTLANRAAPGAENWFKTGELYDDYVAEYGPKNAQKEMDRFMAMVGATTSDARPPVNFRNASYQLVRDAQGLPPSATPPYPYGHKRHASTYLPILEQLQTSRHIDSMTNPKGAHFAGNLSGQTSQATLDRVVSNNVPLRNAGGTKVLDAPADNTYGYVRDWFDDEAAKRNYLGMEWQAKGWGGSNPDAIEDYSKPALGHISDRINVTAKVTGLPVPVVKKLFLQKKIPLLSAGGLGLMGLQQEPGVFGDQAPQNP